MVRLISHPIRIEILRALENRVASPKEVADELSESVSNVSYHFKYLRRDGCVEIVDTAPRRGAVEHYYRLKTSATEISGESVRSLFGEAVRALNAGTLDAREDRHLSWAAMDLDERGWRELVARQAQWAEEVERIKSEAAARLAGADVSGSRVVAAVLGFETPPATEVSEPPAGPRRPA